MRLAQTVGEEQGPLSETLAELGIYLSKKDYRLDTKTLLKRVLQEFFGPPTSFVDMVPTDSERRPEIHFCCSSKFDKIDSYLEAEGSSSDLLSQTGSSPAPDVSNSLHPHP